jgi:mycolic acid cyclopropane synthetase
LNPRLNELRHRRLTWNTPLSPEHAERLLDHLALPPGVKLLDLGCGWGELLLRAVARTPDSSGVGVNTNVSELERGRELAQRRGLDNRVKFTAADASLFVGTYDRVICIGAADAWGGTKGALAAMREHLTPGGLGLYGDGFWVGAPSPDLVEMLGEIQRSLSALVECSLDAGLRALHVDTADQAEWDDFEWRSYRGLEEFALREPGDPLAPAAQKMAAVRRKEYLEGYRGVLGFAYLILARP